MAIESNPGIDNEPGIAQLRSNTTEAARKAKQPEVGLISQADFADMIDRTVSDVDLHIAKNWVSVLSGYTDPGKLGSALRTLTKAGMSGLPKDLTQAKAKKMLAAARELYAAVKAQYDAQGLTETLSETNEDHLRKIPFGFIAAVKDYFAPDKG